jgi:heptosyltransferase-2/heptosyltransferase-3
MGELLAVCLRLRRDRPDFVLATGQIIDRKAPLLAKASGAPYRAGPTNFPFGQLYNLGSPVEAADHYVERDIAMLERLGIESHDRLPRFEVTSEEDQTARRGFENASVDVEAPLIGVCFQTPWIPQKAWPLANVVRLVEEASRSLGAQVALVGNAMPGDPNEAIAAEATVPCAVMTREPSTVGELAALLRLCDVFVSVDSGPAHLAAAVGTATVTLFGPTDPRSCRPLGPNAVVVGGKCPHAPCYPADCRLSQCDCMRGIPVDTVMEAVQQELGKRTAAERPSPRVEGQ